MRHGKKCEVCMDKSIERVVKEIAKQYSFLVGRFDDYSAGKKSALWIIADSIGYDINVVDRTVIVRSHDGSFQVNS